MCRDDQEPVAAAVATQAVGGRHHTHVRGAAVGARARARARSATLPTTTSFFCPPLAIYMLDDGYVPLNYCDCIIPKIM